VVSWLIFTSPLVFSTHNGDDTPQNDPVLVYFAGEACNHADELKLIRSVEEGQLMLLGSDVQKCAAVAKVSKCLPCS